MLDFKAAVVGGFFETFYLKNIREKFDNALKVLSGIRSVARSAVMLKQHVVVSVNKK